METTGEKNNKEFFERADLIVAEVLEDLRNNPAGVRSTALFDSTELAKVARKVWLLWARGQSDAKPGWLVPFDCQTPEHQDVQRKQAEALFALGYAAAEMERQGQESAEQAAAVVVRKRQTMQMFTENEARILLGSLMSFVSFTLRRSKVVLDPITVTALAKKLEPMANIKTSHVEFFVPADKTRTANVKPKWKAKQRPKRDATPERPPSERGRDGLKGFIKRGPTK